LKLKRTIDILPFSSKSASKFAAVDVPGQNAKLQFSQLPGMENSGIHKREQLSRQGGRGQTSCYLLFLQILSGSISTLKVMFLPHCCHGNNSPPQAFLYAAPK